MPTFLYQLTTTYSDRPIEATTSLYSTLLSANRAAYVAHKSNNHEPNIDAPVQLGSGDWMNTPYIVSFRVQQLITCSLNVKIVDVGGPDFSSGETDVSHQAWMNENLLARVS